MMPVSSKRKLDEVEAEETSVDQRKSILDISMTKLRCSPRRKVEPSLRRSVLIFNTLKNIENQLKLEGVSVPLPAEKSNLMPAIQTDDEDVLDTIPSSNNAAAQQEQNFERIDYCPNAASNASFNPVVCNNSINQLCSSTPPSANAQLGAETYRLMSHSVPASPESCAIAPYSSVKPSQTDSSMDNTVHSQNQCNKTSTSSEFKSSENFQQSDNKASSEWDIPPQSNTNSFTESLLSDTSKFILDSLLSSDKLVAVASFSSLFEFDNNGESIASHGPNHNNNNSCSGSQIPPFSCLSNSSNPTWTSQDTNMCPSSIEHCQSESCSCRNVQGAHFQCYDNSSSSTMQWTCYNNGTNYSPQNVVQPTTCRQESDMQCAIGDIDCNSFDFDLFLPSLSPSMKLTPLNHEDLVHSLPSAEVPFSSPSMCNQKTESLSDDLDHIMQILVGI